MDKLKEAFQRIKEDIFYLGEEIAQLHKELIDIKTETQLFSEFINDFKQKEYTILTKIAKNTQKSEKTHKTHISTDRHINQTNQTHISTDNMPLEAPKSKNMHISIGNQGVSTDRQTDRQTDKNITKNIEKIRKTQNPPKIQEKTPTLEENISDKEMQEIMWGNSLPPRPVEFSKKSTNINKTPIKITQKSQESDSFDKAIKALESLDSIKKEIRLKLKRLTEQEIKIFSLIYQLDEENKLINYKTLASKTNLSESSIRDYISRIITKGIPVIKEKINNKQIIIKISQDLRKIASLNTILELRNL